VRGSEKRADGEIARYALMKYGVTFPVVNRIDEVNGGKRDNTHPLFYFLRRELPGKRWYGLKNE
jgi:glutathione peroxidase-family protein